jgi:hypothetical protein
VLRQSPAAIRCKPARVSIFSPQRKVTAPDGVEWEIYVSRFSLPQWRPATYEGFASSGSGTPADLVFFVLEIPLFVFKQIMLPLGRLVVELPSSVLRARRTTEVTVEAVCFWPRKVSIAWTAMPDDAALVVSRVAAALARGEEPLPPDARFLGRVEH